MRTRGAVSIHVVLQPLHDAPRMSASGALDTGTDNAKERFHRYKSKTGLKSKIKRRRRDGTSTASSKSFSAHAEHRREQASDSQVSREPPQLHTESIEATRMAPAAAAVTGIPIIFQPWTPEVIAAVTNPEIILGTGFYLVLKPLLRASPFVNTKKGAYKNTMIAYNALMAIFSAACFVATTVALGWDRGYGASLLAWAGDTALPELYSNTCPSKLFDSYLFRTAAWAFYYSKYVEYLDTAWLVLKGKPVSFLQTFHHFGAPWDVYLGIVFKNESLWIFVWLNAFIHTVMYTYYAIAAAGIPYPAKPLITAMQITQFLGGFSLVWRYKNLPCFAADQGMMISWVFNYLYVGGVLALFLRFFVSEYLKPKKPKSKKQ